jgi:hypothetical protein
MNGPTIRSDIAKANLGKIDTFTDAHTGVALQQEDVSARSLRREQLLLDRLILLRRQGPGQALGWPWRILATDEPGQLGDLCGPSKFLQNGPRMHEPGVVHARR